MNHCADGHTKKGREKLMLGKPKYGWCNIMVGQNKLGCASYLIDVPTYLLDVFNQYLSEENNLNFSAEFDAEGYYFGIMEFNETLYFIRDDTLDGNPVLQEISPTLLGLECFSRADKIIKKLAGELITDIENNFEDWVYWEDDEELMEPGESDNRRMMLRSKINELKEKIHG